MKKHSLLFKFAVITLVMIAAVSLFVACDKTKGEPEGSSDVTPQQTTTTTPPPEETPAPPEAYLEVKDQEATDGKINISYTIPVEFCELYESFYAQIYHDDANDRVLVSTKLDTDKTTANIDTSYGKLKLVLIGERSDKTTEAIASAKVKVWADEYNIASLNATFPVVYFTLDLFSMDGDTRTAFENGTKELPIMKNVPTFISLERTAAYNWEKLPENVYSYPNVTLEKATTGSFHDMNVAIAEYVKELYEINPKSFFNLYCVDNYPELMLKFFDAQGIPEKNYHATMISDGTATVAYFKEVFSSADSSDTYTAMVTEWNRVKSAAKSGDTTYLDNVLNGSTTGYSVLARYALVIASKEDNVDWWCSRDLFTSNTESEFIKGVVAATGVKYFGINDMLSILSENDGAALKELFHFNNEMFSTAYENNKKVLMIVGTGTETYLKEYIQLLNKTYGDEYQIYYKGHPKYPTGLNAEKTALFEELGVIDLDASIAAELIIFYSPDIYLVGWASSTFKSALDGKMLALFDHTYESGSAVATTNGYGDMPDTYYSAVKVGEKTYINIEYADGSAAKYFDPATNTILSSLPNN